MAAIIHCLLFKDLWKRLTSPLVGLRQQLQQQQHQSDTARYSQHPALWDAIATDNNNNNNRKNTRATI